ncbi:unnamed protein product [Dovyalis caffra]|uniref:Helicase C-terminal domain-containing protein n=1 Tax=Dovyalis caffra TaxID=77055 RepID=A0AAV1RKA4_9ROSI|nr:unnamed protein product [Dovyalis caffra]
MEQMDMLPYGRSQTMLLSATFPKEIQRLASNILSDYIFLAVERVGWSTDLIVQRVEYVSESDKRSHLVDLLMLREKLKLMNGKHSFTLVFVETKKGADYECWLYVNGFLATSIQEDGQEREMTLRSFKSGKTPILVVTDVAAKGLTIPHVAKW